MFIFDAKYTPLFIDEGFEKRAIEFWNYFLDNHKEIESQIDKRKNQFIKEIERELTKVLIKHQDKVRFCFFKQNGKYIFHVYFGYNSYLLTIYDALFSYKSNKLDNWEFISTKK